MSREIAGRLGATRDWASRPEIRALRRLGDEPSAQFLRLGTGTAPTERPR
jgi:hypothetical protein